MIVGALFVLLQQLPADAGLEGIWSGRLVAEASLRGPIGVERRGSRWTARLAGRTASATFAADTGRIGFGPDGDLRLETGGGRPWAMWVQPALNGPRYATPVRLVRAGPGRWRGEVRPHDEPFTLRLRLDRQPDGGLRGTFRNPEMNWTGRAPWFRVTLAADSLRFEDPRTGRVRWVQPYDRVRRRIGFDFGRPLWLERAGEPGPVGRVPASRPRSGDGWEAATPAAMGLDGGALAAIVRRFAGADPWEPGALRLQSLLVARRGRLVAEAYFDGFGPDDPHDLRSASKTLTSVLVGIAMERGAPLGPLSPAWPLLGAADSLLAADPRRSRITVGHLLSHSSGLACDDDDERSPGSEDRMQSQAAQPDWYRFTLALPTVAEPGAEYRYCSAGVNLAGGAVAAALGVWLPALFHRAVAEPLGFGRYAVNLMPGGQGYSAGGMYLRPRDFLKLGQVYLDGGRWRGRRIVSPGWVDSSTAWRIDAPNGSSDGWGWHRYQIEVAGRRYREFEASGNGGQFLVVLPELDLAIVATAGNYGEFAAWRRIRDEIVPAIAAAVRERRR